MIVSEPFRNLGATSATFTPVGGSPLRGGAGPCTTSSSKRGVAGDGRKTGEQRGRGVEQPTAARAPPRFLDQRLERLGIDALGAARRAWWGSDAQRISIG